MDEEELDIIKQFHTVNETLIKSIKESKETKEIVERLENKFDNLIDILKEKKLINEENIKYIYGWGL